MTSVDAMEITIVVYERHLREMLTDLEEAKKRGDHSIIYDRNGVSFHVCADSSEKLKRYRETKEDRESLHRAMLGELPDHARDE